MLALPGIMGFFLFYFIPLFYSVYYAFIDNNFNHNFIGLENFTKLLNNEYYMLALANTVKFTIIGVALILSLSTIISIFFMYTGKKYSNLKVTFILPFLIPTGGVAYVWKTLFNAGGKLTMLQIVKPNPLQLFFAPQMLPIYLIFLWKYSGFIIILISGAITQISKEVYEAAMLDGANGLRIHTHITIPLISPMLLFSTVLSIVNSFNIYKEIYYLYNGDYPPDAAYMLQHFMNNRFHRLDYQALSAGAIIFSIVMIFITGALYVKNHKENAY